MADQSYRGHKICVLCGLGGERGRNRTYNLLIKSQLLCQLSYAPAREVPCSWRDSRLAKNQYNISRAVVTPPLPIARPAATRRQSVRCPAVSAPAP